MLIGDPDQSVNICKIQSSEIQWLLCRTNQKAHHCEHIIPKKTQYSVFFFYIVRTVPELEIQQRNKKE